MKFKNFLIFMVCLMMLISINLFVGASGSITMALDEEIEGTDAHQVYWYDVVHSLIFESLLRFDLEVENVVPALASSLEITNEGKDLIFKIPKGLTFVNGDPLTVEDVKKSRGKKRVRSCNDTFSINTCLLLK